jgi:hypothetical protein
MKFLLKLFQFFQRFFQGTKTISSEVNIPLEISEDELIVRGIVHPLFYSKKKISDNAFLPPPSGRKDVSVLRHDYTDSHFCKNHSSSLKIGENTYCGLGILLAKNVDEVNSAGEYKLENGELIRVFLKATPNIQANLPMHADIIYSHSMDDDEPKTLMRKIAKELKKKAEYLNDPYPTEKDWRGQAITKELFEQK